MIRDQELVGAFSDFVAEAEPRLRRALCASYGGDVGRDATAHALGYAWEHWSRVKDVRNPAGYLFAVGRNHARRRRRRDRRRGALDAPGSSRIPSVEPGLAEALVRLSDRERASVVLIHGFEWTFAEVAGLLGVGKSTVQKYEQRGMAKLRNDIGGTS